MNPRLNELSLWDIHSHLNRNLLKIRSLNREIEQVRNVQRELFNELQSRGIKDEFALERELDRLEDERKKVSEDSSTSS